MDEPGPVIFLVRIPLGPSSVTVCSIGSVTVTVTDVGPTVAVNFAGCFSAFAAFRLAMVAFCFAIAAFAAVMHLPFTSIGADWGQWLHALLYLYGLDGSVHANPGLTTGLTTGLTATHCPFARYGNVSGH